MRPTTNFTLHAMLAAVLAVFAATSAAAADYYLKIGDIKGEAAAGADKRTGSDWIEIDSFAWGTTKLQPGGGGAAQGGVSVASGDVSGDSAAGLPAGKRQHKPITVTKELDKATPTLAKPLAQGSMSFRGRVQGCAVGTRYPEAVLQTAYYKYEFRDVVITSCSLPTMSGASSSQEPTESITFVYGKIQTAYVSEEDRKTGKWKPTGWDLKKQERN